jgi:hypothetical protein
MLTNKLQSKFQFHMWKRNEIISIKFRTDRHQLFHNASHLETGNYKKLRRANFDNFFYFSNDQNMTNKKFVRVIIDE